MQAVLALCHFCESHGPRVIITTQSVPEKLRSAYTLSSTSTSSARYVVPGKFRVHIQKEDRCMACTSFGEDGGFFTDDLIARTCYISTQEALNDRVYTLVRYACLRALSCEIPGYSRSSSQSRSVSPSSQSQLFGSKSTTVSWEEERNSEADTGEAVLFGDDNHGYTLSHTFRLRDRKARGFLRLFSFVIVSVDKFLITSNYDFFVSSLAMLIKKLQRKANQVFNIEKMDASSDFLKKAASSHLPPHFLRERVAGLDLDTSRSLAQIMDFPSIFVRLHEEMSWVLQTQPRLCREFIMEGPPTQDMLVKKERELEEGAEKQYVDASLSRKLESVAVLQIISRALDVLPEVNDESVLDIVLTQLVSGGQIVLKCSNREAAEQFLLAFGNLLPLGCIHITYAYEYQHVFMSNLFACPPDTPVSPDIIDVVILSLEVPPALNYIQIPVAKKLEVSPSPFAAAFLSSPMSTSSSECGVSFAAAFVVCSFCSNRVIEMQADSLGQEKVEKRRICDFNLYPIKLIDYPKCTAPRYGTPSLVRMYRKSLLDRGLFPRVLASILRNTREQWLNTAKLIYQLGRQKERIDLKRVLQVTKCTENDVTSLLFFQGGLAKTYKQQVLEIIGRTASV